MTRECGGRISRKLSQSPLVVATPGVLLDEWSRAWQRARSVAQQSVHRVGDFTVAFLERMLVAQGGFG